MYRRKESHNLIFTNRQMFFSSVGLSVVINLMFLVCVIYMSFRLKQPVFAGVDDMSLRFFMLFVCNTILAYIPLGELR